MNWRVAQSNIDANKRKWLFTADWGYMRNLNPRSSLGATLYFGGDDDVGVFGVRPRYRLWLDRQAALDLSAGIILSGNDVFSPLKFPGFVASASIGIGDWMAFSLHYQAIRFSAQPYMYGQSSLYAGLRLGSWAALAVPPLAVLIIAVQAAQGD